MIFRTRPFSLSEQTRALPAPAGAVAIAAWAAMLLCLILSLGCLGSQPGSPSELPSVEEEALLDPSGRPLTRQDFLRKARGAEYILIGETHDIACDHRVQARLIRWLAENGTRAAVGLEMVPASGQKDLDRFNAGRMDAKKLPEALEWEGTWGHPFSLYRPIFRAARESEYPVFGLNLCPETLDALREKGREALEEDTHLQKLIPASPEEKEVLARELERHERLPGLTKGTELNRERFFLIQAAWDSAMAGNAVRIRSRTDRAMIILAGSGHVAHGRGVPRRLRRLDPGAEILTLSAWRGLDQPEPGQSDLLFHCPVSYTSRLGFSLKLTSRGGLITEVEPESRAKEAGMRTGDLLLAAGGEPFRGLMDLHRAAVRAHEEGEPLVLRVEREGSRKELSLDISR